MGVFDEKPVTVNFDEEPMPDEKTVNEAKKAMSNLEKGLGGAGFSSTGGAGKAGIGGGGGDARKVRMRLKPETEEDWECDLNENTAYHEYRQIKEDLPDGNWWYFCIFCLRTTCREGGITDEGMKLDE